ncbi:MAG: beta-galactosidase [Clostridia bacterium]|nr:beta-galactosidase [Clostridia bacterium]MBQ6857886.1 beta-galactosidase [Clostridia bacterium]
MDIRFQPYRPSQILSGHLRMGGSNPAGEEIAINSLFISRRGKPVIPVMGEYHFSRDSRENWAQELAKMKAGGVGIVATYVLWIYHEEIEGEFDFSGDLDLRAFMEACAAQGLEVMLRIGPWAHGECRNGGFPDWLQHSGIPLRCNDPRYMDKARIWYEKVFEQVEGLFYRDGGPIIGVQFENELVDNSAHLLALKKMALEIGYEAPLYTATGWNSRYGAKIPVDELLPVFAGYVDAPWDASLCRLPPSHHFSFDPTRNDTAIGMDLMRDTDESGWRLPYERYPFATCELGSGLQVTHHRRPIVSEMDAYSLSLVKLGCGSNLIGYYMYHGGTNRIGRLSTLQESTATGYPNDVPILNYDFQTCLSQYGEARGQYGLLNMLHLFAQDFGDLLAPMEHVGAEGFVPCTDERRLRACLRTDGQRGFVFVNHHQRLMALEDVRGARIHALGVEFPPIDVCGSKGFFMPVNLPLEGAVLRFATAQPLCRMGRTFFFAAVDGIAPQYEIALPGGMQSVAVQPGLASVFDAGDARIVTLTWDQARFARRLGGKLYIGDGVNLYSFKGELHAIEGGSFAGWIYEEQGFVRVEKEREFHPAQLTLIPMEEPFVPPYVCELELGGARKRWWQRIRVSTAEGFVEIPGEYDAAQIYADGRLVADNYDTGVKWRVPASLLFGRECYLVMSERRHDFYCETP